MTAYINKDTQVCMSLAARPGNTGTRLHNYLYRELGLNYVYKAFTTEDLAAAIGGIRAFGIRGCAISMPFKEDCIPMLDELDPSATGIQSVNTIVNTAGQLKGYNTDYTAVFSLLKSHNVPNDLTFALRGSGGMAKAVACALRDAGFQNGAVVARNPEKGPSLAQQYGFKWKPNLEENDEPNLLINVTPIGMEGGSSAEDLAFPETIVRSAKFVFDVVALPSETPLIKLARSQGKSVITGAEVMTLQAIEQFVLYTGIRPAAELIAQASKFAREDPT
ncbi:shikimate 5-dehydrogenase [Pelagicoccus sp. NFK12]|uniref:Shikimate 5-dehydrogenase n=1 Tax=Pelagicoccus enzymogenes TaxID=2773457 RepID=A0A927IJ98_9BACT|nr:shikimate 5-dehydrogenase [Pelagicoccus enzymogenes]MBD5781573.1 shikimate 5-dehydrogenase [Pelagicoccus enzymogenes]